jgi:spore coat polysaccharide biosynthesis protein SpsF
MSTIGKGAIVVQARMQSTRMPEKVLLPFYGEKTILDLITSSLRSSRYKLPVCIATSTHKADDVIAEFAVKNSLHCFRGDEADVLSRFIGAADKMNAEWVIRVCADNPFLDTHLMDEVIAEMLSSDPDYASFLASPNVPAIKSHWGVFAEGVSVQALRSAATLTQESFYHEHVTNYIYGNEDIFICKWLLPPKEISNEKDIRFTIDTPKDFALMQQIWAVLAERDLTPNFKHALALLNELPELRSVMAEQVRINSK